MNPPLNTTGVPGLFSGEDSHGTFLQYRKRSLPRLAAGLSGLLLFLAIGLLLFLKPGAPSGAETDFPAVTLALLCVPAALFCLWYLLAGEVRHRITVRNGTFRYFHGLGSWGTVKQFPLTNEEKISQCLHAEDTRAARRRSALLIRSPRQGSLEWGHSLPPAVQAHLVMILRQMRQNPQPR